MHPEERYQKWLVKDTAKKAKLAKERAERAAASLKRRAILREARYVEYEADEAKAQPTEPVQASVVEVTVKVYDSIKEHIANDEFGADDDARACALGKALFSRANPICCASCKYESGRGDKHWHMVITSAGTVILCTDCLRNYDREGARI